MELFRRRAAEADATPGPSPFVAEVLRRLGEEYGGFDAISPLAPGAGGSGMEVVIHIAGETIPGRSEFMRGTGIVRVARVSTERTEVFAEDQLIASFDDMTTADVFGTGQ